jgi:hypothetical protein
MNVKPLDQVGKKYVTNASGAGQAYTDGVTNPRIAWDVATIAAEANYKLAVTEAANKGRFAKGVKSAGNDKYKKNAIAKGPARYAEGVSIAENDYKSGIAPYLAAMSSLTLPPRGVRGAPANLQRVSAVNNLNRQLYLSKN